MSSRLEKFSSVAMAVSALVIAGVVLWSRLTPEPPARLSAPKRLQESEWLAISARGQLIGQSQAKFQLVEFVDFQCPFCKQFHATLAQLQAEFPEEVAIRYVHFPLTSHPFSAQAARASDCAASQGRFHELATVFFGKQDSIGKASWDSLAAQAGVQDASAFQSCFARDSIEVEADAHRRFATALGVDATPTVVVNGWRLATPPTMDSLRRMLLTSREGKSIYTSQRLR